MPPGKVLQPVLKMKVDELFLCWLSEAGTQAMLRDCLRRIQAPGRADLGSGDPAQPAPPTAPPAPGPAPASSALPLGAASSPRIGPHVRGTRRSAGTRAGGAGAGGPALCWGGASTQRPPSSVRGSVCGEGFSLCRTDGRRDFTSQEPEGPFVPSLQDGPCLRPAVPPTAHLLSHRQDSRTCGRGAPGGRRRARGAAGSVRQEGAARPPILLSCSGAPAPACALSLWNACGPGPAPTAPAWPRPRMERAEPGRPARPARPGCRPDPPGPPGPPQPQPREPGPRPGRPMRPDMRLRELSLRQDPDLRQELASLARGCDFVLPSRFKKRLKAFQQVQTKEEPRPPAASQSIPAFYFPRGRPQGTADSDAVIARIERTFAQFPHERAAIEDMGKVAKACGCPLYWKGPLFCAAGGERTGSVSVHKFVAMWRKILQNCHDEATRFVHLLMSPGCNYLVQEDFVPFLQDVVNTHPGLAFLKAASEFHSRYITTVIQRIFYTVNRSWSGRITCAELRRSSFLQNVALLEEEADINQLTEFFSYEHFYVIYCKFWELDTDHDLLIGQQDLARHNDHAISTKMIERIFSGAVTRGRKVQEGKISYADFVWFLISEEDKRTPTSIEYWFRCMDLDGDGALSMFELEHFYEEQSRRLEGLGIEALPFEDCLCQMLDLVRPQSPGRITLRDLKRCRLAHVFFDTFFNVEKYLDHEQREQVSLLRETEAEGPELSDWERYAAEEYDLLVAEEAAGEPWDDGYEAELGGLCPSLAQRPFLEAPALGAVHLFDCEADEELQPS